MADFVCSCPPAATIPAITDVTCKEVFGLIGKLAFQRFGTPFVDITDETEWTTKIAAADATKIQVTPLTLDSQDVPSSTPITVGGDDNTTFDGAPIIVGETSVTATFIIRDLPIDSYKEIYEYACEVNNGDTGVYLLGNEFIISDENEAPLKASSFFIGTPLLGGRTDTNNYPITITFPAGWWKTAKFNSTTTAGWNPMDLTNA